MAEGIQIGSTFAGYRVDSVLGRGGMGVVFRAEQPRLGRMVAIKVIAPELASDETFRERFGREARLAAAIEHPNAIPIYEAGMEGITPYLVMRFVDGVDLSSVIKRDGHLTAERAVAIIEQIAGALDEAHHRGLVHRDVKPANVLVEDRRGSEHAYLTDFGLTKQAGSLSGVTATGRWVGTIDYAAPEQIRGQRVDARTDVYSLGCLLFAALTGRLPFERDADVAKLYAHINDPPPLVGSYDPGLSRELDWVVNRALAKDPDERFQSTGDFGRAAHAAVHGERVSKAERTVATGAAAPSESAEAADVAAPTPPSEPLVAPTEPAAAPLSEISEPPEAADAEPPASVPPASDSEASAGAEGPTPSRVGASPGEAPTRARVPLPREKRSKIAISLLLAVVAVAAILVFALGGGDGGGSDEGGPGSSASKRPPGSNPKTFTQPAFTVDVPRAFDVENVGDVTKDQGTSVGSGLDAEGVGVQVVRERQLTDPQELIATANRNNERKQANGKQVYQPISRDPTAEVDSDGSKAERYEYRVGETESSLDSVVNYAFIRGGKTWRTRVQVEGASDNSAKRAGEIALMMASSLKPR